MTEQLVNLTPHPLHIYPADCPDRIEPGSVEPLAVIPVSPESMRTSLDKTRVGELPPMPFGEARIPVNVIQHHGTANLPDRQEGVWFVVALVVALANPARTDLLVPDEAVRNLDGSMIGCRALGFPLGGEDHG